MPGQGRHRPRNLVALDREIRAALALADGCGVVAVNIIRAVSQYEAYVRQACESGAQAIVVGAGLPLDLHLAAALKGDVQRGLFFRGAGRLPFAREIRPVRDLLDYFLRPAAV